MIVTPNKWVERLEEVESALSQREEGQIKGGVYLTRKYQGGEYIFLIRFNHDSRGGIGRGRDHLSYWSTRDF